MTWWKSTFPRRSCVVFVLWRSNVQRHRKAAGEWAGRRCQWALGGKERRSETLDLWDGLQTVHGVPPLHQPYMEFRRSLDYLYPALFVQFLFSARWFWWAVHFSPRCSQEDPISFPAAQQRLSEFRGAWGFTVNRFQWKPVENPFRTQQNYYAKKGDGPLAQVNSWIKCCTVGI